MSESILKLHHNFIISINARPIALAHHLANGFIPSGFSSRTSVPPQRSQSTYLSHPLAARIHFLAYFMCKENHLQWLICDSLTSSQ